MGDKLLINLMVRNGIGEVILKTQDTGLLKLDQIYLAKNKGIPENYVLNFLRGGTGFIYYNFPSSIYLTDLKMYAVSLVITAAHCICNPVTAKPEVHIVDCGFQKKNINLKAMFLTQFMGKYFQPLASSNNFYYCLPGDLAVMILISKQKQLSLDVIEPEDRNFNLSNPNSCLVCGFPELTDGSFSFMYPYESSDKNNAKQEIRAAFYEGEELICSEGQGKKVDNLIEIYCSSYSGMSGSPILCNNKLIGVFLGGPPMPGQFQALSLAKLIKEEKPLEFYELLENSIKFDDHYSEPLFSGIYNDINTKILISLLLEKNFIKPSDKLKNYCRDSTKIINKKRFKEKLIVLGNLKESITGMLIDITYHILRNIKNKNLLAFNVGISINHPAFTHINKIVSNSHNLLDKPYDSFTFCQELLMDEENENENEREITDRSCSKCIIQ
jgi:Trypsin